MNVYAQSSLGLAMVMRVASLAASLALVLCGCGGSGNAEPDSASAALPTHTYSALEAAAHKGTLAGRPDCLWLEDDGGVPWVPLIPPEGYTTDRTDGDVVLFDEQGREVARTGDRVIVGGGPDSRFSPCLDETAGSDDPWLVSSVQRCTPELCSEP